MEAWVCGLWVRSTDYEVGFREWGSRFGGLCLGLKGLVIWVEGLGVRELCQSCLLGGIQLPTIPTSTQVNADIPNPPPLDA